MSPARCSPATGSGVSLLKTYAVTSAPSRVLMMVVARSHASPSGNPASRRATATLARQRWKDFAPASGGRCRSACSPWCPLWADDAEGAADLAVLLGILITAAERRLSNGSQS